MNSTLPVPKTSRRAASTGFLPWTCFFALAAGGAFPASAQPPELNGFAEQTRNMVRDWGLPGAAVAVVRSGEIVFQGGFGARRAGSGEPVDEHTLFAVGSTTKAFTSAAVAMLIDEGKLEWDSKVSERLPDFLLSDAYVTRNLRVRDLMAHGTGLLRGDMLWYNNPRSREEVIRQVRHQEIAFPLRSTFQYNNTTWIATGEIIEELSGQSWDEFIRARFFEPLGMVRSSTRIGGLDGMENVARPHLRAPDGELRIVPYRNIDNAGPAGSINSSASEMAAWAILQLRRGSLGGEELISPELIDEMHAPQMVIRKDSQFGALFPESNFISYGLGWFLTDYRGLKVVSHGGNIDGMTALVALVPELEAGAVILANVSSANFFTTALAHSLVDRLLGLGPGDWSERMLKARDELFQSAREAEEKAASGRVEDAPPSLAVSDYAGIYQNEMYGEFQVNLDASGTGLRASYGYFQGPLEHWHYDTFRASWEDPSRGRVFITFELGSDGSVARATAEIEGSVTFTRVDGNP